MASANLAMNVAVAGDTITIGVEGAKVAIPAATIADLWIERVRGRAIAPAQLVGMPKIGFGFPDVAGIYAGLVVGDDKFATDYHLVVLDGEREDLTWADALAWAKSIGGELPKRKEQAVMFGNVPQLFAKAYYWSSEQSAADDASAWLQDFGDGGQGYGPKGDHYRARAVRRIPI